MDKGQIQEILIETISMCADDTGWANLAKIGAILRKKGLKYGRLSRMLKEYGQIIELRVDESIQPPVAYARIIQT
ncbi:MAG: hypothetical protein KKA81_00080 [Bacteroidetes bacterium]|nr:hypothetical protein [Bacteroidota bacterium]